VAHDLSQTQCSFEMLARKRALAEEGFARSRRLAAVCEAPAFKRVARRRECPLTIAH